MFVNNINPVLLKLGFLEIRYYGLIYALGFVIAYLFFRYYVKEEKLNLPLEKVDDLILYLLIGIVVGARIFHFVFFNPLVIFSTPWDLLFIWQGGLSFHGGLIGAVVAVYFFSKKHKIGVMNIIDASVIPAALGLTLGRIANFTNQELVGIVGNVPWCVKFTLVDNFCRHPYQIYAALTHLILFYVVFKIYQKQKMAGVSFWTFVLGYGVFRIFTDFWREEAKLFGLGMGQYLSIAMVIAAIYFFVRMMNHSSKDAGDSS
ncbi:prolipoprotein diacylglyceryl transferase [Candidatus Woesearchaeota archaeon]|nr:prolipoprotein diacylglyceryl transferase [Candidatus Woesearchaeota archaeon]